MSRNYLDTHTPMCWKSEGARFRSQCHLLIIELALFNSSGLQFPSLHQKNHNLYFLACMERLSELVSVKKYTSQYCHITDI